MITLAEGIAGSGLAFLAAAMLLAYLSDAIGLAIRPAPVLLLSAAAAAGVWLPLRRRVIVDRPQLAGFVAVFLSTIAWLFWIARPSFVPLGSGSDLTHHLLLVEYIEQHWRLIHDDRLGGYLGEMTAYTPGSHLLIALTGAWSGLGGFRSAYPLMAISVAFKCAIVFLIAGRLLPDGPLRTPLAIAAAALLFLPRAYLVGSFLDRSFVAQVVSELFAVAAWGAMIVWSDRPSRTASAAVGLLAASVFLAWPAWIGPLAIVWLACVIGRGRIAPRDRRLHASLGLAPFAIVALIHTSRHLDAVMIATVPGYVLRPTVAIFGWPFLALATAGTVIAATRARTRTIVWLLAAIAAQAATLYAVADTKESPYLAFKMMYLAIYPLAIAGAIGAAAVIRRLEIAEKNNRKERRERRAHSFSAFLAFSAVELLCVLWTVAIAAMAVRSAATMPRPKPIVSVELSEAGMWARTNVDPACVDYLVADSDAGYWLHLARLGNARTAARTIDPETFVPAKAIDRWILPGGVPYAIVEDFAALPRDIRESVDVLARFDTAAVVKRRGASSCAP